MAQLKHGIVKGFDGGTYLASVQITGSLSTFLIGVKVARNIPAIEMVNGRNCLVAFLEPANPDDAALIAVYG